MSDKKFTPKEAALMVLAKAQELYKSSTLAKGDWAKIHSKLKREGYSEESADKIDGAIKAKMGKAETGHEKGVNLQSSSAMTNPKGGGSHAGRDVAYGLPTSAKDHAKQALGEMKQMNNKNKSGMGKSEEMPANPDEKADAALGEKVEQEVQEHEKDNKDPAHHEKGSYKLAKFMGKMEMKKGKSMEKAAPMAPMSPAAPSLATPAPAPAPMAKKV